MKRGLFRVYLVIIFLVSQGYMAMSQCAMCRGSVESTISGGDTSVASNLNFGILYLFVAPYVLLGTLAFFWFRHSKRNGKKIGRASHIAG